MLANAVKEQLSTFWRQTGRRWLTEILIVLGLVFAVRASRRNQRRLRARIARKRIEQARQLVTYPWFDLFWIDPELPDRRERIRQYLHEKRQELIALARDRRTRPDCRVSLLLRTGIALGFRSSSN